jgi:hypothetical protein
MLLENLLDFFPCGASSGLGKPAYSINNPTSDPEFKLTALVLT